MTIFSFINRPILNPFFHTIPEESSKPIHGEESDDTACEHQTLDDSALPTKDQPSVSAQISASTQALEEGYQTGVRKAEAITLLWSKKSLYSAYVLIYVAYFVLDLAFGTAAFLAPYAYADFKSSQMVGISAVMAKIIGGVLRLPLAKLLDIWGRGEGFLLMVLLSTLGLIIYASCSNVASYTTAAVIYYTGFNGLQYTLTVWISDISRLESRVLLIALSSTHSICTSLVVPYIVSSFVKRGGSSWRWGYGCFAIVLPVALLPLTILFLWHQRRAAKTSILATNKPQRTFASSAAHFFHEFDVIGCLILMAGLILFLLPFSLATSVADRWRSTSTITMLAIGFCLLCCFPIWEKYGAHRSYLPWPLLKNRTLLGCALTTCTLFVSYYCWDLHFYDFNQVVLGLSATNAVYMEQIYTIGSCFFACFTGILIKVTKRAKLISLICVPIYMLGTGLMIYFRQPNVNVGYVVMCQIFLAFAGGTLAPCEEVMALAVGTHDNFATILAIINLAASIGGAIGASIAGGIWTNVYFGELVKYLPDSAQHLALEIYSDYTTVLEYPKGTEIRSAVQMAYGAAQRDMCIAGTAVTAITFVAVWLWHDMYLGHNGRQVKGRVF
ncbi:MFS general substrate transporter [Aureobasidium pullulans]|nr:MFS general substrate transporter [Aureobasidium pullulans]